MYIPSMLIFLFQFNRSKVHSQKIFSLFFCKLSVSIPNEQTLELYYFVLKVATAVSTQMNAFTKMNKPTFFSKNPQTTFLAVKTHNLKFKTHMATGWEHLGLWVSAFASF